MSDKVKRELIGSVKLGQTLAGKPTAELYSTDRRLGFPVLTLFDLSMLEQVGIDPNELDGEPIYKRFWGYYIESDKETSKGNKYRDVQYLESLGAPATTTSTDNSALLAELRHHTLLLETIATKLGAEVPEVALGDTDENADWIADPETRAEEQAIHDELDAMHQAPPPEEETGDSALDEWFSSNAPTSPRELIQVLHDQDCVYNSPRTLHDALAEEFGDTWKGWPPADDLDAWSHLAKTALQLMTLE